MSKTAILFGSTGGVTELIARKLAKKLGEDASVFNVSGFQTDALANYSNLILGTSTWGFGDLQDDWDDFLPKLASADLQGKQIALFGLGDSQSYPDTFVDGMGTIYAAIKDKGCSLVGQVDAGGYDFEASTAVINGEFVGLALDEDNESAQTAERLDKWLEGVQASFN